MITTISHLYQYGEIELECELEFEPAQSATLVDPPWPAQAYLISAKTGGVEVLPLLSQELTAQIEEAAAWAQS